MSQLYLITGIIVVTSLFTKSLNDRHNLSCSPKSTGGDHCGLHIETLEVAIQVCRMCGKLLHWILFGDVFFIFSYIPPFVYVPLIVVWLGDRYFSAVICRMNAHRRSGPLFMWIPHSEWWLITCNNVLKRWWVDFCFFLIVTNSLEKNLFVFQSVLDVSN